MSDSFRLPVDIEAFIRDSLRPTGTGGGVSVGDHGDMLYQAASGLGAVPATLGSGFMVMVSRGVGFPPEMIDLLDLIAFITGGESVLRTTAYSVVIPILVGSGAIDSSGAAVSGSKSQSVTLPSLSGSGAVTAVGGAGGSTSQSVVLPAWSGSGVVIPP